MDAPVVELVAADATAKLLHLVEDVARDLDPSRSPVVSLDSRLDRDLGIDSIGRAELIVRIENAFDVSLPSRVLAEADTPRDLLNAILKGERAVAPRSNRTMAEPKISVAVAAPADAPTLSAVLDWHAERHPERQHLILEESDTANVPISYRALAERSRSAAAGLRELGIAPDDRVAIMLPTSIDFFVAFFGALYAGAIPVPIYPPMRASQVEEHLRRQAGILNDAKAKLLVASLEMREAATLLRSLVECLDGITSISDLPAASGALPRLENPDATALIQYTSGSTGAPKGVVLSNANILANIRALGAAIGASSADTFISWLPVYHDLGLIGAWLGCLYYGAQLVIMPPHRFLLRPERWLWAIHRYRGTLSAAPNFAFDQCVRNIEDAAIDGLDLSSLRLVANGSEPVSAVTVRRFTERFGGHGFRAEAMAPAYGLAENTVALTLPPTGRGPLIDRIVRRRLVEQGIAEGSRDQEPTSEIVSCGCPLPGHEVRVIDDTGHELPERREGRIQFRGPSATRGYFGDPEKTAELFDGEWLETGDLGYIAGGELYVTGRTKDIIIRGGRHLHPSEVEAAIGNVPGVEGRGVAAFGTHDPQTGTERLVVVVETALPHDDQPRLRDLIATATIAVLDTPPEEIAFVLPHALPKTASGKLRRSTARQLYETGQLARRRSLRWQMIGLGFAASAPVLRRAVRASVALLYAGYWWLVVGLLFAITWFLVMLLPRPPWRWAVVRRAARLTFWLTATPFEVEQHAELPGKAVIVSNHASYVDSLALATALPGEPAFVAKRELVRKPLARWPLERLGTLFVERTNVEQEIEDVRHLAETARTAKHIVIFPEGGFTRAPGLMPFKLGAFSIAASARLPVVPIAIRGARSILRGDEWFPRRGRIRVTVAEPIAPKGTALAEATRLRDAARAAILAYCGEPDLG